MGVFLERLVMLLHPQTQLDLPPLLGVSVAAREVEALLAQAARHDQPVLIRGAAGTGKARLARRIHDLSDRQAAPFAEVNLLREADPQEALFGATGAFAAAEDGTVYLNGIGRMPPEGQDRFMAEMGEARACRLVASCGTRVAEKLAAGGLRADLFYLFAAHEIVVPSLADRPEDAVWLLGRLFSPLNAERTPPLKGISELTEAAVRAHDWPGNGREVRARLIRGLEAARGDWLFPSDLFPAGLSERPAIASLAEARDAAERAQIVAALERTGGQIAEAAKLLRVARTTLWEKMQKLGF
jgi:DNA-binding NtrC family response regulator